MWWSDDSQNAKSASEVRETSGHKAHWTHELIGGAAAYEAAKVYENDKAKSGAPESHAKAKEMLAGITGATVDHEFETRGLDHLDRDRAKEYARQQVDSRYDQQYGGMERP